MDLPDSMRPIVQSLLAGTHQPGDVGQLFNSVREQADCGEAAKDVADGGAHRHLRNRGLSYMIARAFSATYRLTSLEAFGERVTVDDLAQSLKCRIELLSSADLAPLGFDKTSGRKTVKEIVRKLRSFDGTEVTFNEALSGKETALYGPLIAWRGVPLAFTEKILARQLADALIIRGSLLKAERAAFMAKSPHLILHALSVMHHCRLDLGEKRKFGLDLAPLPGEAYFEMATDSRNPDLIALYVIYRIEGHERLAGVTRIVATDCAIREWVSPNLWSTNFGFAEAMADWGISLKVDATGRLVPSGNVDPSAQGPLRVSIGDFGNNPTPTPVRPNDDR